MKHICNQSNVITCGLPLVAMFSSVLRFIFALIVTHCVYTRPSVLTRCRVTLVYISKYTIHQRTDRVKQPMITGLLPKDVRVHCYCASLVRTLFIRHARATSFSSACTKSKTQQNIELMTFALTWCANIFVGCSVTPTFFSADHFLL